MASAKTVDLFGEDEGHETVIKSILYKIHPSWKLKCVTINRKNQILKALIRQSEADILILAKDSNAEGVVKRRNQLSDLVHESKKNRFSTIIAFFK